MKNDSLKFKMSLSIALRYFEEAIWYIFLFSFPFQRRMILYQQDWNFNEWRSMALYGSDLVFIGLMVFWVFHKQHQKASLGWVDIWLGAFFIIAAASVFQYQDWWLGIYNLLRLGQGIVLYYYISRYAAHRFQLFLSFLAFIGGGVFQAILGIWQFLVQHDLGLRILGESVLNPQMRGVAVFYNFVGDKVMRAYGTFPHPNVLAAYLLTALFAFYYVYLQKDKIKEGSGQKAVGRKSILNYLLLSALCLLLFAFFLTFARTTIFVWVLAMMGMSVYFYRKHKEVWPDWRKVLIATGIITVLFVGIFWQDVAARILISSQDEAVQLRIFFNQQALGSGHGGLNINWLGIGIGNFVSWFMETRPYLNPYLYQPAHNIYLLIYAELGIFGLFSFLAFLVALLISNFQLRKSTLIPYSLFLILCMLFIGLFDHFPWTIQQGRLLFWGVLGLFSGTLSRSKSAPSVGGQRMNLGRD